MAEQLLEVHMDGSARVYQLDPDDSLSDVRRQLGLPFDSYHFVYYNPVLNSKQVLNDQPIETQTRLREGFVFSPGSILLANMSRSSPDFFGHRTPTFKDRHMSMRVFRNKADATASPSDFDPIMLDEVAMANPDADLAFDRVVICQAGSLLQFDVTSWGAAGWGYSLRSERDIIVRSLYDDFTEQSYGSISTLTLRRYQGDHGRPGPTIRVDALAKARVAQGFAAEYSKLTLKCWRLTSYKSGNKTYTCDLSPPALRSGLHDVDAGGDAMAGGARVGRTTAGRTSSQTFGSIEILKEDGSGHVLGAVTFFLYVVRDRQQVNEMLKIVNSAEVEPFPHVTAAGV